MNLTVNQIRQKWLDFFRNKGYCLVQPASLVPENDPSLFWINSGVAALKRYFKNPALAPSRNLVNCQRVMRTDDLSNINQNSYHQTLFEMLGVFSLGGKFKQETIPYFWEFFTSPQWMGLDPKKLFITVYQDDKLTYQIWKEQKEILSEQILYGSKKTNFWDMGSNGPCGPNTEIYYSLQTNNNVPKKTKDLDNKGFLEICNIVFSESYRQGNDYLPLKEKCVDVGGGLERMAMVVQDKKNSFQIDLWQEVIKLITNCYKSNNSNHINEPKGNFYVIADHLRTAIFALADGAKFEPKGRGYILRKLVKRAVLLGYFLNFSSAKLIIFSQKLIDINSSFYVHLRQKNDLIIELLKKEIIRIMKFIKSSTQTMDIYCQKISSINNSVPARDVFLWYDTHGIPEDLIKHYLKKKGYSFPKRDFSELLEKQKKRSKEERETKKITTW